jgi:hypothetical protein
MEAEVVWYMKSSMSLNNWFYMSLVLASMYKSELHLMSSVLEHQLSNEQSKPVADLHHLQNEGNHSANASDPGSLPHTR